MFEIKLTKTFKIMKQIERNFVGKIKLKLKICTKIWSNKFIKHTNKGEKGKAIDLNYSF